MSNPNDYCTDLMGIITTFWILEITDWWHWQEEMHSKYTNLSNVARDMFCTIPHSVGAEASFSLGEMLSAGSSQIPLATLFANWS